MYRMIDPSRKAEYEAKKKALDEEYSVKKSDNYGYCPHCSKPGVFRERRPNGNDKCQDGHIYPTSAARKCFNCDGSGYVASGSNVQIIPCMWCKSGVSIFRPQDIIEDNATTVVEHSCLHLQCGRCRGSGMDERGRICVHAVSCPCPKCSNYSMSCGPIASFTANASDNGKAKITA